MFAHPLSLWATLVRAIVGSMGDLGRDDAKTTLIDRLRREIGDERVAAAIGRVPREAFVPEGSRHLAYQDIAVPIGEGQTVSQPYIVALMVSALDLKRTDRVLEIGAGSGYQAAILAELAAEVVSVERLPSLVESARERLERLRCSRVRVVLAEEELGWPRDAPYDAIIVAAAAPKLGRSLMGQLADGGRLVLPVGSLESQQLMKVTRSGKSYAVDTIGACRFVPLIGKDAWSEQEARERFPRPTNGWT